MSMPKMKEGTDSMEDMVPFNGLRGVCAMAIFLGHQTELFLSPPWPATKKQTVIIGLEYCQAVSLFFLLSGIPLSRLYSATGKLQTWQGTAQFWRKRWARLGPIYYLALCLNLVVILLTCDKVDVAATMQSFFGCAFLLQGWYVPFIHVGGVLWQVAVFAYGYLLFPFYSNRIREWEDAWLRRGILFAWLLSVALWFVFGAIIYSPKEMGWWIWHVHCLSRLPHIVAGVLLGEIVERRKPRIDGRNDHESNNMHWATVTDGISVLLLFTAIQAPIVQWYCGTDIRSDISIGLEAWLLPLHALWLAGMVLAYQPDYVNSDVEGQDVAPAGCRIKYRTCWTRRVLSFKPLTALGEISLALYCLHLVVMFFYASTYAYVVTGDWRIASSMEGVTLRVQIPWWHAPIQWALVIAVSFGVFRWFEAPLRRMLTTRSGQKQAAAAPTSESAALLSSSKGAVAYGDAQ